MGMYKDTGNGQVFKVFYECKRDKRQTAKMRMYSFKSILANNRCYPVAFNGMTFYKVILSGEYKW